MTTEAWNDALPTERGTYFAYPKAENPFEQETPQLVCVFGSEVGNLALYWLPHSTVQGWVGDCWSQVQRWYGPVDPQKPDTKASEQ